MLDQYGNAIKDTDPATEPIKSLITSASIRKLVFTKAGAAESTETGISMSINFAANTYNYITFAGSVNETKAGITWTAKNDLTGQIFTLKSYKATAAVTGSGNTPAEIADGIYYEV